MRRLRAAAGVPPGTGWPGTAPMLDAVFRDAAEPDHCECAERPVGHVMKITFFS